MYEAGVDRARCRHTAARLERAAPGSSRRRSEFIRAAIRKALWELEEHVTEEAYARQPDASVEAYIDPRVWTTSTSFRRHRSET